MSISDRTCDGLKIGSEGTAGVKGSILGPGLSNKVDAKYFVGNTSVGRN
jgi:hypothetical protein